MSDSIRKKIVYIIFSAASVWGVINLISDKKTSDTHASNEPTVVVVPQIEKELLVQQTDKINIEEKIRESWGRDPFKSKTVSNKSAKPTKNKLWQLSGIIYNSSSPVAVINKKPVQVGEKIDNARVVKIDKKEVTIEYNGHKIKLTVSKG